MRSLSHRGSNPLAPNPFFLSSFAKTHGVIKMDFSEPLVERGRFIASMLRASNKGSNEEVEKFVEDFIKTIEEELKAPREKIRYDGMSKYYKIE